MLWDEPKIFFLERRYFFSIILSEFLKNRVALQRETEVICQIAVAEVDGEKIQPGVWYDIDFVKREAVQK